MTTRSSMGVTNREDSRDEYIVGELIVKLHQFIMWPGQIHSHKNCVKSLNPEVHKTLDMPTL